MKNINYNAGGYWISPNGNVHVVGFFGHDRSSREIVANEYPSEYDENRKTYVTWLENHRWIHISGTEVTCIASPTNEQYESLLDLAKHTSDSQLSENLVSVAFS